MTPSLSPVHLGLGSNLGDREANLHFALEALSGVMSRPRVSSLYETGPVGVEDQPPFLNLVVIGTTDLEPQTLLERVKAIERSAGRTPTFRWGPRILDIDILLFGGRAVDLPDLTIPHPRLHERLFALAPLCEVDSTARWPDGSPVCADVEKAGGDVSRLATPYWLQQYQFGMNSPPPVE